MHFDALPAPSESASLELLGTVKRIHHRLSNSLIDLVDAAFFLVRDSIGFSVSI
jgi:hypothetical protein